MKQSLHVLIVWQETPDFRRHSRERSVETNMKLA